MVREHHVAVLPVNYVSVLCMRLCVSGGSYAQYTYMIDPGVQPRGAPEPYKYFSHPLKGNSLSVFSLFLGLEGRITSYNEESDGKIKGTSMFRQPYKEVAGQYQKKKVKKEKESAAKNP